MRTFPKIGMIGIGGIAASHWQALQRIGAPVVAVMSRNPEKGLPVAEKWGATYCSTVSELVKTGVEVVIVATPTESHAAIIHALVREGVKRIFCEKPLARTLKEARSVEEICCEQGVFLGVGYKMRFETGFRTAKESLEEGKIGSLLFLHCNYFQPTPPQPWYLESGVIREILSHVIDLGNWFLGEPETVFCTSWNFQRGRGEDRAHLVVTYKNNLTAILNGGWIANYPELPGRQLRNIAFQLVGEKGYMWGIRGKMVAIYREEGEEILEVHSVDAIEAELRAFLEAMSEEQQPPVGLREGLMAQSVIEAALRSAQERCTVDINEHYRDS